ncbi:MAG: NAD(P)-binding protein [Planctomycetota bacterium]
MPQPRHVVAVVGGAVSGSVAAAILAGHGVEVVVFEQNSRPYGKIEDGLPRWHVHQRKKEYERIDERLRRRGVHFVPLTKLGRDVSWHDVTQGWGFSAVLLANGAWRDRPLLGGAHDESVGRGLLYQNPLIHWFNHKAEAAYDGPRYDVPDGTIVFGGGLASLDVVKVCQLEIYGRALRERGLQAPMLEMEKKGIPAVCERQGIDPAELGVEGCLLLYRRRRIDMPLAQPRPDATPEQMQKTYATRQKLLEIARNKYLFRMQDRTLPLELITADGRVTGVKTVSTEVEGRKATPIAGTEETLDCPLVISSIGSVPEKIPGIHMKGETYTFSDWDLGVYEGAEGVFGVGNVVTGQGNIRASLLHSKKVAEYVSTSYLGAAAGAAGAEAVHAHLEGRAPLEPARIELIRRRVRQRQSQVSYDGDYGDWIAQVTPPDLE